MKHRRPRPKKHSDALLVARIENQLIDHALGQLEMSQTQVQAAKAVYDKLRPSLSAIDQNVTDARDAADPAQLAARLAAMFNEKPELFEQVVALKNENASQQSIAMDEMSQVKH